MNFLSNLNYYSYIKKILINDDNIDIAVAFWGKDAISLFEKVSNKKIRIICNLESGACNPKVIKKLLENNNIELRTNKQLHAKVLLQPSEVIIGSANISANGLSLENSEQSGWIEAGVRSKNKQLLKSTKKWYDETWKESLKITKKILEAAEVNWRKRRANRPLDKSNKSFIDAAFKDIEKFVDRNIYIAIYRNQNLSSEATTAFDQVIEKYSNLNIATKIDCYEDWSELPDNAYLINLYYGPKKGFTYCGINFCPEEPMIEQFKYKDGTKGEIKIVFKKKNIHGYKITKKDQSAIKQSSQQLWNYQPENEDTSLIPFRKFIEILQKNHITNH